MGEFVTITADPPWPYDDRGKHLRSSAEHRPNSHDRGIASLGVSAEHRYGVMTMADLAALPIADQAADNAHLYLWTTNAFICEAHDLARAWGFKPKTVLTYVKVKPDGTPSMKVGNYFRGATEHIVFAVRGRLPLATTKAFPTAYLWPRTPHSVKPEHFYQLVEEASPGPYLEVFAREAHLGWSIWGNHLVSDVDLAPRPPVTERTTT
jgi:N6-adenosine-specific RNA methylase IME4